MIKFRKECSRLKLSNEQECLIIYKYDILFIYTKYKYMYINFKISIVENTI
jgi:hypothetical protein